MAKPPRHAFWAPAPPKKTKEERDRDFKGSMDKLRSDTKAKANAPLPWNRNEEKDKPEDRPLAPSPVGGRLPWSLKKK